MANLSNIGRIFYGIAIAAIGLQSIYYHDFPYILSLPDHFWLTGHIILAYIWGIMFVLAGVSMLFKIRTRQISLLFGSVLLLIFFFYYIPYEILTNPNYLHLEEWENAEKELAFAGGALVIAACFAGKNENRLSRFLEKLIPLGAIFFAITLISFGILHFLEAKDASTLVPSWIPGHLFWIYFAGVALIGSGIAIILKIKVGLIAALLGLMIFLWFVLLHIPRVIAAPPDYISSEVTSAFLALAYSGIGFVIGGEGRKKASNHST
jgi:uncharacterized membrane protein YphA (DoxX/SURF4 family)